MHDLLKRRSTRLAALLVFIPLLLLWTWKLLEPNPVPDRMREFLSFWDWLPFVLAKCLHTGCYAFLTALALIWVPTRRGKVLAIGFMLFHGVGTEIGQTYVPNRVGSIKDVLIDSAGVFIGVIATRWLNRVDGRPGRDSTIVASSPTVATR